MSFSIEDFSLDFFSLHNKVAIVTGAAGELGRGLCSALAKAGANLLLVDIKEPDNKYLKHLTHEGWICPYISRHLLSLNPLQARCRRYSRGER